MKKLKHNKDKSYTGLGYIANLIWLDSQVIIVAPDMRKLKKFYLNMVGDSMLDRQTLDPTLCKRVKVSKE